MSNIVSRLLSAIVRMSPPPADGGTDIPPPPAPTQTSADFGEAIEWHRQRDRLVTRSEWDDLSAVERRRAFFETGIAHLDLLQDVHDAIGRAVAKGTTLEDFKKEIGQHVIEQWKGTVANPAARLENIFRTNVQVAYGAGRYAQARALSDRRPFWRFNGIKDTRQSNICRPLNGTIRRWDDAWWHGRIPPLHYQCRSSIATLTKVQAERAGVTADEKLPKELAQEGFGLRPDATLEQIEEVAKRRIAAAPASLATPATTKANTAPPAPPVPPSGGGGGGGGKPEHHWAHWLPTYEPKYASNAGESLARGRASLERGLDAPVGDVFAFAHAPALVPAVRALEMNLKASGAATLRDALSASNHAAPPEAVAAVAAAFGHQVQFATSTVTWSEYGKPQLPARIKAAERIKKEGGENLGALVPDAQRIASGTTLRWKPGRAFHSSKLNRIQMPASDVEADLHTLPHEFGHAIEHLEPALLAAAVDFLLERTRGDVTQYLQVLLPNHGYGPNEVTRPDKFFDAYVGKQYRGPTGTLTATEVTSMGLQELLKSVSGFYRADDEHFLFVLGQLERVN